jgi:cell division transport system ATP-binding protein
VINFVHISKIYGKRKKIVALDDVSFEIKKGEFVSIVGPSGAGKSTIVRLLICEEKPTAGKITVGGYDITKLNEAEIPYYRRKIGVVFQDFKLLPQKTVAENVAYALEVCGYPDAEIRHRVPKILEMVGLAERSKNLPDELSGGEKQRTSMARALVHGPRLLIADEPTGNLDPKTSWEIVELLTKINDRGTIVILATHDKEIVNALGKRVITIKNGQLVSDEERGRYRV